jgi:hypothetical protein
MNLHFCHCLSNYPSADTTLQALHYKEMEFCTSPKLQTPTEPQLTCVAPLPLVLVSRKTITS